MRRPNDPKDPKGTGEKQPTRGGRARERMDLFNRQRGLPTDSDLPEDKDDPEADKKAPTSNRPRD